MRRVAAILVAAMAIALAGCAARAKQPPLPPAPAPPAAPLSMPQTQVDLPPAQAVNPDALTTAPTPPPPTPAPPVAAPPSPSRPARRAPVPAANTTAPPKPDAPPEAARPPIREILAPEVADQLRKSTQAKLRETRQLLAQAQRRQRNAAEQEKVTRINQFVKLAEDTGQSGDLRQADALAERAVILARELQSDK